MNRIFRILPILLAAALQIMPLVRNLFINPATGSSFAFILRWGIGTAAAIGTVDAVSGATNSFALPTNFVGTSNVFFTNNLTLTAKTSGDGGALCTILTNGVAAAFLSNGQTTTNGMPAGLTFKFIDRNTGSSSFSNVYCIVSGTPTKIGTNAFHVDLFYQPGTATVPGNFTIAILAASSGSAPTITNNPVGVTNVAGGAATFSVTAGGVPAVSYQWRLAGTGQPNATNLLNATNASLALTNLRASQTGDYTVVITNSSGSVTSSIAALLVTNPLPTVISSPANNNGGLFQFTFVPVIGLTNSVQTNSAVAGEAWNVFTNIPPPVSANPITITDPFGSSNRFYRVMVVP